MNIVDFAYQIIDLHEENRRLKHDLAHYKELHSINSQTINNSIKSSEALIGDMLNACIDPKSIINRG